MDYICEREVFLQVRQEQKNMVSERQKKIMQKAYEASYAIWLQKAPKEEKPFLSVTCKECGHTSSKVNPKYSDYQKERSQWMTSRPSNPKYKYSAEAARHLNIFYAIIKGKTYEQVEPKVRQGNGFNVYCLKELCITHKVDFNAFSERMISHAHE